MVFLWRLSNRKFPKVSRTLLSILADLNNAVVWVAFSRPLISESSNLIINSLVTVPSAPITIGIIVTFRFLSFSVLKQGLRTYLFFRFQNPQFDRFFFSLEFEWQ